MMTHQQQAMVERVDQLERMVVRLNGRIGELQRELNQTKALPPVGGAGGSRLWTFLGGMKAVIATRSPIRENRRVQRHDLCLF
ncbi:MAG: hypothetical protein K0S45_2823 [Nitrospira sp.]|nr:hypothetical protein [Nitrospira sp.]